jgi:hypothetical protein
MWSEEIKRGSVPGQRFGVALILYLYFPLNLSPSPGFLKSEFGLAIIPV